MWITLFFVEEDLFFIDVMAEGFLDQISVFGWIYDITSKYDTELNENSENAVQNKILTEKINDLTDTKANQSSLDETNETLRSAQDSIDVLEDKVSNIIPIEIEEIDDLFGL